MPRKTRKEKVAAKAHKQVTPTAVSDVVFKETEIKTTSLASPKKPMFSSKKSPFPKDDMTREYFMKDLKKSLIIVFLILFVEFALYFANLSGILTSVNF